MQRGFVARCVGMIAGGVVGWIFGWLLSLMPLSPYVIDAPAELVELSLAGVFALGGYSIGRWGMAARNLSPCWDEEWVWKDDAPPGGTISPDASVTKAAE